jgi:hypothetical protein
LTKLVDASLYGVFCTTNEERHRPTPRMWLA